jgi:hypothetical protein
MCSLATKKTLSIATIGAIWFTLGNMGTAPATAALFRLNADLNDGSQFSITYDGDAIGTVSSSGNSVSYSAFQDNNAIVDFSFVSPNFSYSLADFVADIGTPTSYFTYIQDVPSDGESFIQNDIRVLGSGFLRVGLPIVGDVFAPVTSTSLQMESRGSFLPVPGGPLSCCTPNFLLSFDGRGENSDTVAEFVERGEVILLNSGGTYEIARIPTTSTPEPLVPWWAAGVLVGGWWLRGLWFRRNQR